MFTQLFARRGLVHVQPRNVVNLSATLRRAYSTPRNLSEGEQNIYAKLTDKFQPTELAVQDVSGAFVH